MARAVVTSSRAQVAVLALRTLGLYRAPACAMRPFVAFLVVTGCAGDPGAQVTLLADAHLFPAVRTTMTIALDGTAATSVGVDLYLGDPACVMSPNLVATLNDLPMMVHPAEYEYDSGCVEPVALTFDAASAFDQATIRIADESGEHRLDLGDALATITVEVPAAPTWSLAYGQRVVMPLDPTVWSPTVRMLNAWRTTAVATFPSWTTEPFTFVFDATPFALDGTLAIELLARNLPCGADCSVWAVRQLSHLAILQ
jgi:hypothetical protein